MSQPDFECFFDLTPDLHCIASADGHFIRVNESFRRHLGWHIDELVGQPFTKLVHPDDVEATSRVLARPSFGSHALRLENRFRSAAGNYHRIVWTAARNAGTGTIYAIGRDTSEVESHFDAYQSATARESLSLEVLRVNKARLAEAQRMAKIGSWELDLSTNDLWWSDEIYRIFEVAPPGFDASYDAFLEVIHPDDREAVNRAYTESVANRTPYAITHRLLVSNGSIKFVFEQGRTDYDDNGKPIRSFGTVQDVTERVEAEEALRRNAQMLRLFYDLPFIGMAITSPKTKRWVKVNQTLCDIFGYSHDELVKKSWTEITHPDDLDADIGEFDRVMRGETDGYKMNKRFIRKDGAVICAAIDVKSVRAQDGSADFFVATIADTTEQKRAEEDLRIKDLAISTSLYANAITDADGKLIYVNPAFVRLWGYTSELEILGKTPMDFAESESTRRFIEQVRACGTFQGELVAIRRDGTRFDIMVSANSVLDGDGNVTNIMGSFLDMTTEKDLQAQFIQAQKMESIGRLAGGVAHDYNNMLTVIIGNAELALEKADPSQQIYADLTEISRAAQRSANITRQLLAFARKQTIAPTVLDLNQTVEGMLKMLRRLIGEDLVLAWIPAAKLWPILMDPAQLDQILANLCINARDAVDGVGRITIATQNISFDEVYCADRAGFIPGDFVMLTVIDDGSGMDKETLAHIFEPFFTTKPQGEGTGLGLATVYGIIKQNNGFIDVYSETGKGTSIRIYLPRYADEALEKEAENVASPPHGCGETVLLVEDETSVLKLAGRILEGLGYSVLTASTPGEAMALAGKHASGIQLLITDIIMPEMNGRELAERLQSVNGDFKCLFMSGYTAEVIAHHGVLHEGLYFIQKPFSVEELASKVRMALDS